jgi:predicted amidophosphoribosyltransferase
MAIPNLWRTKKQRYSLQGEVCVHCERAVFPPREVCPHCHKPMGSHAAAPALVSREPRELPFVFAAAPAQPQLAAVVGDD